jgi:hypothetical protein
MATGRKVPMPGINSGHHYIPTYQILMISDNVDFLQYCGGHFEMAIGRNCLMSGMNSEHQYALSTQISNYDDIGQY